jgi:predicted outer membrane repeat protein
MRTKAGRWLVLCLLVGTFGAFVVPQAAGVTAVTGYVISTGSDAANDCTHDWNPCATLQYAIDQANAGDTIKVAGTIDSNVTILKSLTITGWLIGGPPTLDGTNSGRVVTIDDGANTVPPPSVTLSNITIENGNSSSDGGGVLVVNASLTVDDVTFSNNSASGGGGAIANDGTLTVQHSTFSNNSANGGGAIADGSTLTVEDSTFSRNSSTSQYSGGGAIYEFGSGTVLRSTLTGNTSPQSDGGGVFVDGIHGAGQLLVAESTFYGNSASGAGGAVANTGWITIESSTLTGNSACCGAAIASGNFNVRFAADIFAEHSSPTCAFADSPIDPSVDAGYNIDDDGTCGLSSANHSVSGSSAIDNYLGSLVDNFVQTPTVPLLNEPIPATSAADPALGVVPESFDLPEAVDGETAACSVPDERGVMPAAGLACDIGAYLLQPTTVTLTASSSSVQPGDSVTYTATVYPIPDDGIVTFSDNAGSPLNLGCVTWGLISGTATCTVSYPKPRVISVTAAYSGDGARNNNYAPSTSDPLVETIRDTEPPSAPEALTGRIADNALDLSWQASHDNIRVTRYVVYLGNTRITSVAGDTTEATVRFFHRRGPSVFTVRAFDAARNRSGASNAVTAVAVPRPNSVPKRIPDWAWRLLSWQTHHIGARPIAPQPLPNWYASWRKWRDGLFRLTG